MATRIVNRHYDRALAPAGVTTTQYAILARVEREGAMRLGRLADRLALERTTLTRELQPLLDERLAAVRGDPADRRRKIVGLTARGRKTVERARPLWAEAQAELSREFGDERTGRLLEELHALVGAA
jgi:DNA-binding MarR family transcriptional regulator